MSVVLLRVGDVHGRGACMVGACMLGEGMCMAGSMCGRGHALQGTCMGGACMAGETATAVDSMHPTGLHSCLFMFPNIFS